MMMNHVLQTLLVTDSIAFFSQRPLPNTSVISVYPERVYSGSQLKSGVYVVTIVLVNSWQASGVAHPLRSVHGRSLRCL